MSIYTEGKKKPTHNVAASQYQNGKHWIFVKSIIYSNMIFMVVVIWNGNKYKCHTKNKMIFKLGVTSINQAFKKDLYGRK